MTLVAAGWPAYGASPPPMYDRVGASRLDDGAGLAELAVAHPEFTRQEDASLPLLPVLRTGSTGSVQRSLPPAPLAADDPQLAQWQAVWPTCACVPSTP